MLAEISVIIPVFNGAEYLPQTLESVLNQTFTNWQLIIVDDHSTDNTMGICEKLVESDRRIIYFLRPDNLSKGANSCRNFGFGKSQGEFIQWFDSDDLMDVDFLEKKVNALKEYPEINYVVSKVKSLWPDGRTELWEQNLEVQNLKLSYLQSRSFFWTGGPMFRKSFFENGEKLFDPTLKRHQEMEFYFRVLLKDSNFKRVDTYAYYRRGIDNQLSATASKKEHSRVLAFELHKRNFINSKKLRSKDSSIADFFYKRFRSDSFYLIRDIEFMAALKVSKWMLKALVSKTLQKIF
jgi:glycosyltransferase involved in cell wall biosynthesis